MRRTRLLFLSGFAAFILTGCASQGLKELTGEVLSATGFVSRAQSDALFEAGEAIGKAATPLSEEQEYYLGRAVAANLLGRYPLKRDDRLQRYVNLVGRAVAAHSPRPELFGGYQFAVVESQTINAMATPGGFIFVTSAFINRLPDEDTLAAVLAHEVAHVSLSHGLAAISESNLRKAVSIVGREALAEYTPVEIGALTDLLSESVDQTVQTLVETGYSRGQEYDADLLAGRILKAAGYETSAFERVFKILQAEEAKGGDESGWLSTHPNAEDRLEELEDEMKLTASPEASARHARFRQAVRTTSPRA